MDMVGTTLELKKRPVKGYAQIPLDTLRKLLDSGDRAALWNTIAKLRDQPQFVHDRHWLEYIATWQPKSGLSLAAQAPWLSLQVRLDVLMTGERDCSFWISPAEVDLVWARMTAFDFMPPSGPLWAGFVLDFMSATGKTWAEG